MSHAVVVGIGVVVGAWLILWAFARFRWIGAVVAVVIVVAIGGPYVKPIRTAANGVADTIQAPITAARQLMNKKWWN